MGGLEVIDVHLLKLSFAFGLLLIVSGAAHVYMGCKFRSMEGLLRIVAQQNRALSTERANALEKVAQLQMTLEEDLAVRAALKRCADRATSLEELKGCVHEYVAPIEPVKGGEGDA
jgi:hypothetical protein